MKSKTRKLLAAAAVLGSLLGFTIYETIYF